MENLYTLCRAVEKQIEKVTRALENEDGKLSAGDLDYLDKLTHTLKNIKTTMAMMEADENSYRRDSRGRFMSRNDGSYRGSYDDGADGSYRGGSYRGGSYRGDDGQAREQLNRMMQETTDEKTRRAIQKALQEM